MLNSFNLRFNLQYIHLLIALVFIDLPVGAQEMTKAHKEAIEFYQNKIQQSRQKENIPQLAAYHGKLAYKYWNIGKLEKAETHFQQALGYNKELENQHGLKTIYYNLGLIAVESQSYDQALQFFDEGIQIARNLHQQKGILNGYINKAAAYQESGQHRKAISMITKAISLAKELDNLKLLRTCYGFLSENHKALGNTEKSMQYFDQYSILDKHLKEKAFEQIESQTKEKVKEIKTEKEKQEKELADKSQKLEITADSLKRSKQITRQQQLALQNNRLLLEKKEAQLRHERLIRYGLIGVALLISFFLIIILKQNKAKKIANEKLAQKNKQINLQKKNITDSIEYASRIQQALLPPDQVLENIFPDYFIFYRPRDMVSGDFYWITQKDHKLILAAADCTGHGVPGAFMSMLGIAFLNEIVNKNIENKHIYTLQANEVLNGLRQYIINSLHQEEESSSSKDGIDMALTIIDFQNNHIQYAGAYNPLYLIRKGGLTEKKPDRMPVAIHRRSEQPFTNHEFRFYDDDVIYLFSDGFYDQLGGEKGRKFMSKNFKKLLLDIHQKPMDEQKDLLNQQLLKWKKGYDQLDDILVIGLRLKTNQQKQKSGVGYLAWHDHTILIVEDTELNYFYLTEALKKTKVNIIRAEDGEKAIQQVKNHEEIDLILMDIDMPAMDGFTCSREIKKLRPQIPIIAQTAHNIDNLKEKTQQAGCDDYYTKPIQLKQLLNIIAHHLQG